MKKRKSRENAVAKRKREVEEMRANKVVVMEAAALVAAEAEDQQWIMRAVADEQMSWGTQWFPFWDVELMAGSYFSALYNDVWDGYDDIWVFRASDQIPSPALRSPSN